MRCVIGLGNPGKKYELSKHNIGFIILDYFAHKHKLTFKHSNSEYYISEGKILSSDFFLIKPTTFMNMSGLAVGDVCQKFNLSAKDLLIVLDDINLEFGKIRLRKSGSDGGHNGLKSIIYYLNSNNFARLRFGIGNKFEKGQQAEYVLSKFSKTELSLINRNLEFSTQLLQNFITGGYQQMADIYSQEMKKINEIND